MSTEKLLNARQAALLLNRSHEWVYEQIRRGLIPIQLIERIGLTRPPAIRIEEKVCRKLAQRLQRLDQARAKREARKQALLAHASSRLPRRGRKA